MNLSAHTRFEFMVAAASTCANDNMRIFGEESVFFTKRRNNDGFEHHLYDLPSDVAAIIRGDQASRKDEVARSALPNNGRGLD